MNKETEKEFDEEFPKEDGRKDRYLFNFEKNTSPNCWDVEDARPKIKSFIDTHFIDKRILEEEFEKFYKEYAINLDDLKKKLL